MILQLLASGDDNSCKAAKSNTEKEKRIRSPKQISVEETHNREHKCHHQTQVWNNSYYCHDAAAPLGCLCRLWRSKGSTQHQSTQQSLLNSYKCLKKYLGTAECIYPNSLGCQRDASCTAWWDSSCRACRGESATYWATELYFPILRLFLGGLPAENWPSPTLFGLEVWWEHSLRLYGWCLAN